MPQCHVPEDLNPMILVSWDVLPCSLVNSHETLAAAGYQTAWRYIPEYGTLHIHCLKTHNFKENGGN